MCDKLTENDTECFEVNKKAIIGLSGIALRCKGPDMLFAACLKLTYWKLGANDALRRRR